MSNKKGGFESTDERRSMPEKKMRKKWRIKQNGRWFKISKKCLMESDTLRTFYGCPYLENHSLFIKRTSILIKALEFCKKRGEIRTIYASHDDQHLLQHKLQEFDSNFLKQIKNNEDAAIDLIDAAGKLDIKSLYRLLFKDVVDMIARKTPEDIEKVFKIHIKKDDEHHSKMIDLVMDGTDWSFDALVM